MKRRHCFIVRRTIVFLVVLCICDLMWWSRSDEFGNDSLRYTVKLPKSIFSCAELWKSNAQNVTAKAFEFMSNHKRNVITDKHYLTLTKNCSKFREERGYIMSSLTIEERMYPIAYSIVMYKDVEQAERLLRAIYRPQNVYCVHIDLTADSTVYNAMTRIMNCFPNVFHAPERLSVVWGKLSVMMPDLSCMKVLLQLNIKWRYFINLTGQEFPLKTNAEIVKILKALGGANDLEGTIKRRNRLRYMYVKGKLKPPAPHSIEPYKGNMHMLASRGFVDFIINDKKSKDFFEWVKDTKLPEEIYFSSLQHNAHLGAPGAYTGKFPETNNENKPYLARYFIWLGSSEFDGVCHGRFVREVCIMGVGDIKTLVSRKELFVNKFFIDYQYLGLDCLEQWIFTKAREEYTRGISIDTSYYSNLEFVKNCNCNRAK